MVTMGYNMATDRLITQLLDAFNCAKDCVQNSAEHSCANNTSTSSIAQGDYAPRNCDTNGCGRSKLSSIESPLAMHSSVPLVLKPLIQPTGKIGQDTIGG